MPPNTRKHAACQRCHKKKVKCFGGVPCQNCQTAGIPCTFPFRDRNIVVSEAYIYQLQALAQGHPETAPSEVNPFEAGEASGWQQETPRPDRIESSRQDDDADDHRTTSLTLRHATAEAFVSGLKRLSARDSAGTPHPNAQLNQLFYPESYSEASNEISNYDYVSLRFDTSSANVSIQLPPYPYAVQLVSQFEAFMAYEYHWYLRHDFHSSLETTYRYPSSAKARDSTWLCKLLLVFALGESFNSYEPPLINLARTEEAAGEIETAEGKKETYLPGARFFEQALSLFKLPSEEPELEHVEALNLISFFCHSLNRRKTAYLYAGISARIANNLMLHSPATTESAVVAEHRKRVWWTTFLMDAMVSSERGLRGTFGFARAEHSLPSDEKLSPSERTDFWDSNLMTAHIRLNNVRILILDTVGKIQGTDFASYEKVIEVPLRKLEAWKRELPPDISFDFSDGVPQAMLERPSMRSLGSCYLRFHQGYIMLIRPVFYKLLEIVLGKEADTSSIDGLIALSSQCLEAAKCNMRIVNTLFSMNLLAKYGFYESLHLFSSIKIFSLSRLVNAVRPLSLVQEPQDLSLCSSATELLHLMAKSGNLASKGHVQMLEEIDDVLNVVSQGQDAQESEFRFDDIFPWLSSINGADLLVDINTEPPMMNANAFG